MSGGVTSSIGEELLFEEDGIQGRPRDTSGYTIHCESDRCCLLQLNVGEFVDMGEGSRIKSRGGGESLKKDFTIMLALLKENYSRKLDQLYK